MTYTLTIPPLALDVPKGHPEQGPEYTAQAHRRLITGLLGLPPTRGGATSRDALQVRVEGRSVTVEPGTYIVGSQDGAFITTVEQKTPVGDLEPADPTNPRQDRVVLRVDSEERAARIEIVAGAPSAIPTAPTVQGSFEELATVSVPRNGGGEVAVTDKRRFVAGPGAALPVRSLADLNGVPIVEGMLIERLDQRRLMVRRGGDWVPVVEESDTGWVTVPPQGSFELYTSSSPIRLRRRNGVVQLTGVVKPRVELDGWSMGRIAQLPTEYRPSDTVYEICQGSGTNRWLLSINAAGAVDAARYAPDRPGTNTWLPFHITYLV